LKLQNKSEFFGFPAFGNFGSMLGGGMGGGFDPFGDSFNSFHNIEDDMQRMQGEMSHQPLGGNT
jgi:hypothetical protein